MSNISMVEAKLPPGFRFHPRDEELVCDYLMKKVTQYYTDSLPLMIEVDLNKCEPWDIPGESSSQPTVFDFIHNNHHYHLRLPPWDSRDMFVLCYLVD